MLTESKKMNKLQNVIYVQGIVYIFVSAIMDEKMLMPLMRTHPSRKIKHSKRNIIALLTHRLFLRDISQYAPSPFPNINYDCYNSNPIAYHTSLHA